MCVRGSRPYRFLIAHHSVDADGSVRVRPVYVLREGQLWVESSRSRMAANDPLRTVAKGGFRPFAALKIGS